MADRGSSVDRRGRKHNTESEILQVIDEISSDPESDVSDIDSQFDEEIVPD